MAYTEINIKRFKKLSNIILDIKKLNLHKECEIKVLRLLVLNSNTYNQLPYEYKNMLLEKLFKDN